MPSTILSFVIPFTSCLQSFPESQESALHIRWLKYWSFSFSSSSEYSGLICFRIDWLISFLSKGLSRVFSNTTVEASVLQCSAFFMVQLSHPYMTTGKTIALTRQTFVGKVMSLLFNMLSSLVIVFLPRSKLLLGASFQGAQENKACLCFHCFPIYLPWSNRTRCRDLHFLDVEFWANFFTLLFHFHQEALWFLFAFCHKVGVICILRLLIFLPAILIPTCVSSSSSFPVRYSAYKLNKHGDNMQPWCTAFPILNQSIVPCAVLTVASWLAYRFYRREVRWSDIPISLRIFHSLLWSTQSKAFSIVNEAEVDVFLELSCFFHNPTDVGNLTSGSSAFSKSSLNIRKFPVHGLLKPCLENFEHYFASVWGECSCAVVWAFFVIAFLWLWNENWYFPVLWPLLSFPNFLAYWV